MSWLWVDDVQNSAKPCGFQSEWSVLPADHYAGLRLLTLPGYPTCGSVVVYEAQRSFHTTQITNLTVPLSTAHLNWFLPIMWLQWCQFFFFFLLSEQCPSFPPPARPQAVQENSRGDFARERERDCRKKVTQNLIISMIFADLVQLESGCCYLWFWEPLIILIKISLLLIQ